MAYRLKISREVQHQIDRLPGRMQQRVCQTIAGLADSPRPPDAKPREHEPGSYYWIRIDDYRIIYAIDDDVVQVEVIHVAKRTPKTYAGLS